MGRKYISWTRDVGRKYTIFWVLLAGAVCSATGAADAAGDIDRGERAFRACVACHSLQPGRHLTGPSLAGIWGKQAGTVAGFTRYSEALKAADLIWNAETLDAWLKNPRAFIPKNRMTFRGIPEPAARQDLIAYLQAVAADSGRPQVAQQPTVMNLKAVEPGRQVTAIRYCGDTYRVTTRSGESVPYWEFNLRFKTDSSENGPPKGQPVLLRASMMGDRAFVIFASPQEISTFIEVKC